VTSDSYRLLVIEGDRADARLLQETLAAAPSGLFAVESVGTLSEGLERLASGGTELVLVDLELPDSTGLETFVRLRQATPGVPMVVLSASDDVELAIRALRQGAQDYLVKGEMDGASTVRAITYAIERQRVYQASARRADQLEALRAAGLEMATRLEPRALMRLIAERGADLVGADAGGFYLRREKEDMLEWAVAVGEHVAALGSKLTKGEGLAGAAWEAAKPIVAEDYAAWDGRAYSCSKCALGSMLAVPVQWGDTVIGVLVLGHREAGHLPGSSTELLELFAAQAAVALENARLYGELRLKAEQLEATADRRGAELRSQAAQAEAILMSSADGIVVADSSGKILAANPVAEEWLGQALSPREARRLRELIGDLAVEAERRPQASLAIKGLDLELRAAPVPDQEEGGAAAVVNIHDVTHLNALNRMRARFVSDVSHELRTPVTAIKLYAELMRTQPERWQEFLKTLAEEADRQGRLVGSILEISRMDAGRLEMKPQSTGLEEIAEATIASHRALAEAHGVALEHKRCKQGAPIVPIDPEAISRAVNNLVENGIWYTPRGGKVVLSCGVEVLDGRQWATLRVEDSGVGIPEDELPRVFDRFFRGEKSREMQVPGSGLGLAIVKEIVELHGGSVTAESRLDEGSTFTIWLPWSQPSGTGGEK
jgi:signal transduction histidine kinase/DNA-binding NarL/FixJ family response regulator